MKRYALPFVRHVLPGISLFALAWTTPFSLLQAQHPIDHPPKTYTYKIINSPNNTFGYDIYANGKLLIHQPSKPALPGNEGFKSNSGADQIAQLVINKIKKGEMPPTITIEEMKKLKAI